MPLLQRVLNFYGGGVLPGALTLLSVRQSDGTQPMCGESSWQENLVGSDNLTPNTLFPQCFKAVFSGLPALYAGLPILTNGTLYFINYREALGAYPNWIQSTYSPPGNQNRPSPSPAYEVFTTTSPAGRVVFDLSTYGSPGGCSLSITSGVAYLVLQTIENNSVRNITYTKTVSGLTSVAGTYAYHSTSGGSSPVNMSATSCTLTQSI